MKTIQKRFSNHKSLSQVGHGKFYDFCRQKGFETAKIELIQSNIPVGELFEVERDYIIAAGTDPLLLNTMSNYKKTAEEMMTERRKRDREYSRAYYKKNKEYILSKRQKNNISIIE
jgi:hypothetical protein